VLLSTGKLVGEGFDPPHSTHWCSPCPFPGKERCSSTPGVYTVST
jgi:hypothetical protein